MHPQTHTHKELWATLITTPKTNKGSPPPNKSYMKTLHNPRRHNNAHFMFQHIQSWDAVDVLLWVYSIGTRRLPHFHVVDVGGECLRR